MPIIDSMSHLRTLSQTQGSFIRLNRNNAQLTTSTTKAHFWQRSLRKAEKDESRAAAERVRDSVCAHCGKAATGAACYSGRVLYLEKRDFLKQYST